MASTEPMASIGVMTSTKPGASPKPVERLLERIRAIRHRDGARCPHCSCDHVQGWGRFSGRKRYRCTGCRRTFSDLTGTPAAYIKKLELWPAYEEGMREGESLRAAGRRLDIHPSTAFRWRHRLLRGLRDRDPETLTGWIEVSDTLLFAESRKGQRSGLGRPARTRGVMGLWSWSWAWWLGRDPTNTVRVLVAHDRLGHVVTGVVPWRPFPTADDLAQVLGHRLRASSDGSDPVLVVARSGRALSGYDRFVQDRRASVKSLHGADRHDPRVHIDRALAYRHRLKAWLARFRGVATRYLPHYLVWHRWLLGALGGIAPPASDRATTAQQEHPERLNRTAAAATVPGPCPAAGLEALLRGDPICATT